MQKAKRKNTLYITILVLATSLLQGCLSFTPVKFQEVGNVQVNSNNKDFIDVDLEARIVNPNKYNIVLKKGVLEVRSRLFGSTGVTMPNKIKILKNSTNTYSLTLRVSKANKLTLGQGILALSLGQKMGLKFNGKVRARAFIFGKTFKIENVEGDDILKLMEQ